MPETVAWRSQGPASVVLYPGSMITGETGKPWTDHEVRTTVTKYFDLLVMDVRGQNFVKEAVYRELSEEFGSRSCY